MTALGFPSEYHRSQRLTRHSPPARAGTKGCSALISSRAPDMYEYEGALGWAPIRMSARALRCPSAVQLIPSRGDCAPRVIPPSQGAGRVIQRPRAADSNPAARGSCPMCKAGRRDNQHRRSTRTLRSSASACFSHMSTLQATQIVYTKCVRRRPRYPGQPSLLRRDTTTERCSALVASARQSPGHTPHSPLTGLAGVRCFSRKRAIP